MENIADDGKYRYILFENPLEIDRFKIANFDFFKVYGFQDYKEMFKIWLRKFPTPIFICALDKNEIIAYVYVERYDTTSHEVIYVLRTIEVQNEKRKKNIATRLFLLGLILSTGYLITKPLTKESGEFFNKFGFKDAKYEPSLKIKRNGYVYLPLSKKVYWTQELKSYFKSLNL